MAMCPFFHFLDCVLSGKGKMVEYRHARRAETLMSLRRKRSPPSHAAPGNPLGPPFAAPLTTGSPKSILVLQLRSHPWRVTRNESPLNWREHQCEVARCGDAHQLLLPLAVSVARRGLCSSDSQGPALLARRPGGRVRNACTGETLCSSSLFPGWRTVTTAPPNTVFEQAHVCAVVPGRRVHRTIPCDSTVTRTTKGERHMRKNRNRQKGWDMCGHVWTCVGACTMTNTGTGTRMTE